jgi:hypothetical protein
VGFASGAAFVLQTPPFKHACPTPTAGGFSSRHLADEEGSSRPGLA